HTASARALYADVIRDVCARPAVLLALGEAIPGGAVTCAADRRRAVADGVARALELALALGAGDEPSRHDVLLLEEAERRLWEPVTVDLARVLQRTGPDGLFAFLVVDGATRREAWRADTLRRRAEHVEPLTAELPQHPEHESLDLARFRLDVEQAVDLTARRTGVSDELAYGMVMAEVSYAEAGRRTGRTPNGLWMAIARLRPEWRGVAERGRAAGLGGGILVRVTDRTETAVRRLIRWRLVGGTAAALLLAGAIGAAVAASVLEGSTPAARPPLEPALEASAPAGEGPYGPIGRILAIEAAARLLGGSQSAAPATPDTGARTKARTARSVSGAGTATTGSGAAMPTASCGLGSAALACR
ncbi:MAG: hypothetical protein ACR2J9_06445, partial [Gaiellales bacterium]